MIYFVGESFYKNKATIQECFDYCKTKTELGLDIETSAKFKRGVYDESVYMGGLDPYLTTICMLQIGDKENQYVIDVRVVDITPILPLFSMDILFIGHNLKFEYKHIKHNYKIMLKRVYDTMLADQIIYNGLAKSKDNPDGMKFSLEALCERYLGIKKKVYDLFHQEDDGEEDLDKSIRLAFINIGNRPFTEDEITYGAKDIEYPILFKEKQEKNKYFPHECLKLEFDFLKVLGDIELRGIAFDKEQWLKTYASKVPIYESRLKKLNTFIESNYKKFCKTPDLFSSEQGCNILWSSPDQVITFLKHLGICPKEKSKQTKKLEYTCGAKAVLKMLPRKLKDIYEKDEDIDITDIDTFLTNYLLWNKSKQCCTTFGEEWLKSIHPITGRVHSSYTQILNTGRMCVSIDTLLTTDKGLVRIGDIIPKKHNSEKVLNFTLNVKTHTGKYQKVTHSINKGKEEMYEVELETGHIVKCTLNHKFLTNDGWYSLKDILSLQTKTSIYYDDTYKLS